MLFGIRTAAIFLCSAAVLFGQAATGSLLGVVSDPSGAVIPGAQVDATHDATGLRRYARTSDVGTFAFHFLEPGSYTINARAAGFTELVRGPVRVGVTDTINLELRLQVGSADDQAIVVREDAPLLQTITPVLGSVFTGRQITELPLVTRNFTQLLALQAGVVADLPDAAAVGHGTQGLSVSGSRYYDNNVLIDGVSGVGSIRRGYTDIGPGPLGGVSIPAPDAVEEFKVQTNLPSAEFGGAGGGNVNLITKSGTNELHGAAYHFFRNEALNANEFFRKRTQIQNGLPNRQAILRENRFGGTLGGPLRRERTFFFGSYQGTRQLNGSAPGLIASLNRYPLLPVVRTDEASLRRELGSIFGGRRGFLGALVAADGSNISPVALRMLLTKLPNGEYLLPSFAPSTFSDQAGGRNGGQVFADATFSFPSRFNEDQYVANLDHLITPAQTIAARVFWASQLRELPGGNVPGFGQELRPQNRNVSLTHTLALGATIVNELRAGFVRIANPAESFDAITAADVGMKAAPGSPRLPQIAIFGSGLLINSAQARSKDAENLYSVSNTLSKTAGAHQLRFGASYVRHQLDTNSDLVEAGQLIAVPFEDFLIGASGAENGTGLSNFLAIAAQTGSFEKSYRFHDLSFFVQDEWRVRRNLTISAGLRYDYFAWPTEARGRIGNFDPALIEEGAFGTPPAGGSYTGFVIPENFREHHPDTIVPAGVTVRNKATIRSDLNNFGPRIGFAWQPAANWSVRGGYGVYYPRVNAEFAIVMGTGFPFNSLIQAQFGAAGSLADPFTHLNLPPASAFPIWTPRQYTPGSVATAIIAPIDYNARNPYVQHWNLTIQRELGKDLMIELGYIGSHGLRLINSRAANTPELASEATPIRGVTINSDARPNIQARSPVAGVAGDRGVALTTTDAESKYHAGVATVTKRFGRGLTFLTAFTYGKSIDNNTLTPTGSPSNAQTPGDNRHLQHYGLSAFDRKYRSATSFVYELPGAAQPGTVLAKVLNGWQAAGVFIVQSGVPLSFSTTNAGNYVKLQGFITPDLAPGRTLDDIRGHGPVQDRLEQYFSTPRLGQPGSVFAAPAPTSFGALGRGLSIRGPGQKSLDLGISKLIVAQDRWNAQLRCELYNAMNWVNFGAPGTSVVTPTFGTITSTTTAPRVIQFAVKLRF